MFVFNSTATTVIYTLSLHDALPIYGPHQRVLVGAARKPGKRFTNPDARDVRGDGLERPPDLGGRVRFRVEGVDRKSTRLNSSHSQISYAVFCLKKKKKKKKNNYDNK